MTKTNNDITIHLSNEEMYQYVRGAAQSEDQDIWRKLIEQYQRKMTRDTQDYLWARCRTEMWEWYFDGDSVSPAPIPPMKEYANGAREFLQFLAAYNSRNWCQLLITDRRKNPERIVVTAYWFDGHYYMLHTFDRFLSEDDVKCIFRRKMWTEHRNGYIDAENIHIYNNVRAYKLGIF